MAKQVFLEFEKQIEELQSKIDELSEMQEKDEKKIDLSSEIEQLKSKTEELLKKTYAELTPWQTSLVARHPHRPYMLDYVQMVFTDFHELHATVPTLTTPQLSGAWLDWQASPLL